ncbi:cell growth-regulating nucleolar protein-like [Mya arenaria]|uniref:cell growth-regulating nucleolar protein-like n=1 Tax=Mya arenaria TaxID=6604 RepID=UPI0022DF2EF6|nr:cell growth-regulating nucleolar protein-like [Mya arenaria]
MVVFACNACGESLKKNQVEKHYYTKCRSCNVLSCLDCGKDFCGNEYEQHTKCVSEEEKYSGKNYVAKPNANKNEIKQQQWLQQVQLAIDKAKANPQLRELLVKLKDFPNIPRKQNKFINFLGNSVRCRNPKTCSEAWKVLMENVERPAPPSSSQQGNGSADIKASEGNSENTTNNLTQDSSDQHAVSQVTETEAKKTSKREKKEERRKKAHKNEKKDKQEEVAEEKKSRKKKRKRVDSVDNDDAEASPEQDDSRLVAVEDGGAEEEEESSEPVKKKFKTKFNWAEIVQEVLESKGPEIKIKKLRKKVLAEYLSQGCTAKSEEKLWATFEKKLKRNHAVKIMGDRVKLVTVDR